MKKHIYLPTSNLKHAEDFLQDLAFEPLYNYPKHECEKGFPHEWGRIKTDLNYYHILLGNIPQKGCPWCGGYPEFKELKESFDGSRVMCCMECSNCGATGPIMNAARQLFIEAALLEEFKEMMRRRFGEVRQWDNDFVNPYE